MTPQNPPAVKKPSSSFATRRGLPALTGTPRQIEWAAEIRERLLRGLDSAIRSAQWMGGANNLQDTKVWISQKTDSAWWIERRHLKPGQVIRLRYAQAAEGYAALLRRA